MKQKFKSATKVGELRIDSIHLLAKYKGECVLCNGEIVEGEPITWEACEGAAHKSCSEGGDPPDHVRQ